MTQTARKNKHANDNSQAEIIPTDRMDFLAAVAMDHGINAKESLAARAAVVILKHRHNETGNIVLKHKTIAAEIGCSVSALKRAVKLLKERWFDVEPVYRDNECVANRYDPRWAEAAAVGGIWSIESKKLTGEVPYRITYNADGSVASDDRDVFQDDGVGSATNPPPFSNEPTPVQYRTQVGSVTTQRNSVLETQGSKPSALISDTPERPAPGMRARVEGDSACGADRQDVSKQKTAQYRQTAEEAAQTFERIERMPWKIGADDPEFDPTPKAKSSEKIHWHKLLKSGIAASRIERAAERFMAELPESQRPCLAGFLGRYARQCIDPEEWLYIPDDEPSTSEDVPADQIIQMRTAANDNREELEREAVG